MAPRKCPFCKKQISLKDGYYFDAELNLICGQCNKVVWPVSEKAQIEFAENIRIEQFKSQITPSA